MSEASNTSSARHSLMLVTRNLPPLRGGMERLNQHLVLELAENYDLLVLGPTGSRSALPGDVRVVEVRTRPLWRFLMGALFVAVRQAVKLKPRIVVAGSGLTAPISLLAGRLARARCVVYLHGLDIVVRNRLYQWLWLPSLRHFDLYLVNSRHTAKLAVAAGLPKNRVFVVNPGVTLPEPQPHRAVVAFRQRHRLDGKRLLLSVGRLTRRKGLLEFVRHALPQVVAQHPDTVLVIIGDEAPDALAGKGQGSAKKLGDVASELHLGANVLLLGACSDEELNAAYASSDLCVFPVLDLPGDVEGFGMVAIEAAAHGLPTVAFDVGGIADAVAQNRSGWLINPGDYAGMASRIITQLSTASESPLKVSARDFAESFVWSRFGAKIRKHMAELTRA